MKTFNEWDWQGKEFNVKVLYSRAGVATQILVEQKEDSSKYLIDVGDGVIRDLLLFNEKIFFEIKILFISHGHFDHCGALMSLLSFFRMLNRTQKLIIVVPKGVVEVEKILSMFFEIHEDTIPYEIEVFYSTDNLQLNNCNVSAFPVKHRGSIVGGGSLPQKPSVGYILEKEGERIAYTGDTGYFSQLEDVVKNTDFLLVEGTYADKETDYHLSLPQAIRIGKLAKQFKVVHRMVNEPILENKIG